MAILKCKMCGGDIELSSDKTFGTCENCGSVMTFPEISDEAKADAFNRGNYFRRRGEFDKALQVYERILQEEPGNAEAHWCCALCRFGIEYVEDPETLEYLPTCHRASFDLFTRDVDYLAAVENAEGITKKQYQKDAAKIVDVQRGILATSQNEKPFDVFICYKESSEDGERTFDSILAQEIYYQLTDAGLRVFFSRITLEDKAGSEYEPYIFAALHSAKAMICVATKAEHLNSAWVKNEWSRFLALMRKDRSKVLLPCYKDMSPYDLPEELSVLQSYDMTRIGFIQDLIRGVKKIVNAESAKPVMKETVVVNSAASSASVAPLLERAFMFLEDGKWADADEYCEKVLDAEPKNAGAYLGKLMAELKISRKEDLKLAKEPFDSSDNAVKAGRFDPALAEELRTDNEIIRERNENERKNIIYNNAVSKMKSAVMSDDFDAAAGLFDSIKGFSDSDEKAKECLEKAEEAHKDEIYAVAVGKMDPAYDNSLTIRNLETAISIFESIIDWKDSKAKIEECKTLLKKTEELKKQLEDDALKAAEKRMVVLKKVAFIGGPIAAVLIVFLIVLNTVILPSANYKKALAAAGEKKYEEAISLFGQYPKYKDTQDQIAVVKLEQANNLLDEKKYDEAYEILESINKSDLIDKSIYERADEYLNAGDYDSAYALFNQISEYKDAHKKIDACLEGMQDNEKWSTLNALKVDDYYNLGLYEQDGDTGNGKEEIEWRVLAKEEGRVLLISKYVLDIMPYNTEYKAVTWEKCSLRKWLNDDFYKSAFSDADKSLIINTTIADKTPNAGKSTDKVFLLSDSEARKYFAQDSDDSFANKDRIGEQTSYLRNKKKQNSLQYWTYYRDDDVTYWWLRTRGLGNNMTGAVDHSGCIDTYYNMIAQNIGVRPAIWIKTSGGASNSINVASAASDDGKAAIFQWYFVNTKQDDLRVRSEPGEDASIEDTLPKGTKVIVLKNEKGWSYIDYNGGYKGGYVKSDYLKQVVTDLSKVTDKTRIEYFWTHSYYSGDKNYKLDNSTPPKHVIDMMNDYVGEGNYIFVPLSNQSDKNTDRNYVFIPKDFGTGCDDLQYVVSGEAITGWPVAAAGGIYPDWAHGKTIEEWYPLVVKAIAEQYPSYGNKSFWITLGGDGYNDDVIYAMPDDESCTFEVSYDLKSVKKGQVRYFEG